MTGYDRGRCGYLVTIVSSMRKTLLAGVATLMVAGIGLAAAQPRPAPMPQSGAMGAATMDKTTGAVDWNQLRDARVAVVKAALQLKPDQQQYWPALEQAIRTRSENREHRLQAIRARINDDKEFDPIQFAEFRADNLIQRGQDLKKVADAWKPIAATLDSDQKRRMRILGFVVLSEMRDAIDNHRAMQEEDEEEIEY